MEDAKRSYHKLKLRLRRRVRKQRRQVEDMTVQADDSLDKHLFKRVGRLYDVRRFVLVWLSLLLFAGVGALWQVRGLDKFYLRLAPTSGGVYREGIIGAFTTANPLFAVGNVDVAVSELVFSGLFRVSPDGTLEPDLATGYKISDNELVYTVSLRENVLWHDGEPFGADDVAFTYNSIQNPDVKSPLATSWEGVKVTVADAHTVVFTLPNTLSSFRYSLTNGIIPEHILGKEEPANLRSALFNSVNPIGTGPFTYESVEVLGHDLESRQEKITLGTNPNFYRPVPLIDGVVLRTYRDEDALLKAFQEQEVITMVGLQTVPDNVLSDETVQVLSTPLRSQVLVFLNNSAELLKDKAVRQALSYGTDAPALRQSIGYQLLESDSPFLKSHFAYNPDKVQRGHDIKKAEELLDGAGWAKGPDGKRMKDGKPLTLRLVSQSLTEYATVVQGLQRQWGALGVTVDAILQPEEDIQAGAIARHDYDVLLYGIALGADPDVFAFWHSTQADVRLKTRLNLSEYANKSADAALEGGRTRSDEALRKVKYQPFVDAWIDDAPAIALYQPRFLFISRGTLEGYRSGQFNSAADRFYSINDWQVRRERTVK